MLTLIVLTAGLIYGPEQFSTEADCRAAARMMVRASKSSLPPTAFCFRTATGEIVVAEGLPQ